MKMLSFTFILQLILFIQIHSSILEKLDGQLIEVEGAKCEQANHQNINVDECVKISPSLQLTGINEGQCCKISLNSDTLFSYKLNFGEDWRKKLAELYNIDENITEEELREKYFLPQEMNMCQIMIKSISNLLLYQFSLLSTDGLVKYDCGEGEKTFNVKEYHPTDEDEIFDKDMADCQTEISEKNCQKKGMRVSSNDAQCCWCEKIPLSQETLPFKTKGCDSYGITNFKEHLTKDLNINKARNLKFEQKCECYNKSGKTNKGSFNTVTGEVLIE